jgi:hypothetical protein
MVLGHGLSLEAGARVATSIAAERNGSVGGKFIFLVFAFFVEGANTPSARTFPSGKSLFFAEAVTVEFTSRPQSAGRNRSAGEGQCRSNAVQNSLFQFRE